jgi:type I restriction enzyme S subunit
VEALIANAREQKTALMQMLLSGRTRLPGFDAEWLRKRLGDFVAPERSKCEPQSLGSEVRVIELEHIEAQTGRIIGTALAREQASLKTPFTPNHVLYGKLRPYLRKFARPTFSGVCSTEIWALSANPAYCTPGFLNLLVQTTTFDGAVNISAGSKMPRAEWGVVAEASVALPSLPEQLAISGLMETVSAELENREEQLGALRQEKAALMQQLLTGKRRVKLAESEAA